MKRAEDSPEAGGPCYTLYLEYLGGLVPILKGRRISKLRPEFVIMDPKTDSKAGGPLLSLNPEHNETPPPHFFCISKSMLIFSAVIYTMSLNKTENIAINLLCMQNSKDQDIVVDCGCKWETGLPKSTSHFNLLSYILFL